MRGYLFVFLCCVPLLAKGDFLAATVVPFPAAPGAVSDGGGWLVAAQFPGGTGDVAFSDKIAIRTLGYEPFKDLKSYRDLVVEGDESFLARQAALLEHQHELDVNTMSKEEYCKKYPLDTSRCGSTAQADLGNTASNQESHPGDNASYSGYTIGGGTVVANNRTHGGSCYPAAKSTTGFGTNKIFTTGRYERISPAFEKALITVFRKEGECGIIPGDQCGYTCYGIGENCIGKGVDVRSLTRADAEDIYYNRFWKKYNIDMLPDVISGDIFLAAMGSGPGSAILEFRKFLHLPRGYTIDADVVRAVENYQGDIHNDWLDARKEFLIDVAARLYNNIVLQGWMNGIRLKRENGCHVIPKEPLLR